MSSGRRSKHQAGKLNGQRKGDWRGRLHRLGRHLKWRGRRLAKTEEPFDVQVTWPFNIMSKNTAADVAEWVLETPNRWWMTVEAHCDSPGGAYIESAEFTTGQQVTALELAEWRKARVQEVESRVNANHLWLVTFETGIL